MSRLPCLKRRVTDELEIVYRLTTKEFLKLGHSEKKSLMLSAVKNVSPLYNTKGFLERPAIAKTRAKERFYGRTGIVGTGIRIAQTLLDAHEATGHKLYAFVAREGNTNLYTKQSREAGFTAIDNILDGCPYFAKREKDHHIGYLEASTHTQGIALIKNPAEILSRVPDGKHFEILEIGSLQKYSHLSLDEQVYKFVFYLCKPSDARFKSGNESIVSDAYLEWFEFELSKEHENEPRTRLTKDRTKSAAKHLKTNLDAVTISKELEDELDEDDSLVCLSTQDSLITLIITNQIEISTLRNLFVSLENTEIYTICPTPLDSKIYYSIPP